jgi:hypothetical protein
VEKVGRHDHFFELGGHSLLAITLIDRMQGEGLHADVRTVFTTPTLADLAAVVAEQTHPKQEIPDNLIHTGCSHITPELLPLITLSRKEIDHIAEAVPGGATNIQDIYPLTPLQEGILFHHLLEQEGDAYLLSFVLAFSTREQLDTFIQALQSVIDRHDMLRTAVLWDGLPEPVQIVWRQAPLAVENVHLSRQQAKQAGLALREHIDPRKRRIDIRHAPLIRAFIAEDSPQNRWLLGLLNHHLAIDHTTLEIIVNEVRLHLAGETKRLPEPLPFRNFVAQSRSGVSREEHEAFFRRMLATVDEPTAGFSYLLPSPKETHHSKSSDDTHYANHTISIYHHTHLL